jgi:RHS repeat-associated protein
MTQSLSPNSKTVDYTYDDLNRRLTEDYTGVTGTEITYGYDSCTQGIGKLCSTVMTSGANTAYVYDGDGDIVSESYTINGSTYVTSYTYDVPGDILSITYPDLAVVEYLYYFKGLPKVVKEKENGGSIDDAANSFVYAPNLQLAGLTYGNGVRTDDTLDSTKLYRLTSRNTHNTASVNLQNTSYTYDGNGNITAYGDTSATSSAKAVSYTYDALDRLMTATTSSVASGTSSYSESYSYDALGNITSKNGQTYLYQGNTGVLQANPHAVTSVNSVTYTYDNDGNMTSDGTLANTYNYKDQLTQTVDGSTTVNYYYDADGNRVWYKVGSLNTYYPNKYFSTDGTTTTKQIYLGDKMIATYKTTSGTTTHYYVQPDNIRGSSIVTDSTGTKNQLLDYLPFGDIRLNEQATSFDEKDKFGGHPYDADTDLNYLGARYYNAKIGRFISEDPTATFSPESLLSDPQQLNTYAYARNNPLTNIDPDGRLSLNPTNYAGYQNFAMNVSSNSLANAAISNPYVPAILGSYPLAVVASGGTLSGAAIGLGGGILSQYAGDVAGNLANGANGVDALRITSNATQYSINIAAVGITGSFGAKFTPAGIGLTTAATSFIQDRAGGQSVSKEGIVSNVVNGVGSALTEGALRQTPGIPGRLPSPNSVADFTGAHAAQSYAKQIVSGVSQFVTSTASSIVNKIFNSR